MGHSRTPTQNTAGDGFPAAPIDGYARASIMHHSHTIELAAIGQLGMVAAGQIRLAVVRDRHHNELEQRHEDAAPARAGQVVKNDGNDGDGHARLEIRVTNSVRLTTVTLILPLPRRSACMAAPR
jgi:hypothetical protein